MDIGELPGNASTSAAVVISVAVVLFAGFLMTRLTRLLHLQRGAAALFGAAAQPRACVNSGLSVYSVSLSIEDAQLQKYKTHGEIIEALRSLEYISYIEESRG